MPQRPIAFGPPPQLSSSRVTPSYSLSALTTGIGRCLGVPTSAAKPSARPQFERHLKKPASPSGSPAWLGSSRTLATSRFTPATAKSDRSSASSTTLSTFVGTPPPAMRHHVSLGSAWTSLTPCRWTEANGSALTGPAVTPTKSGSILPASDLLQAAASARSSLSERRPSLLRADSRCRQCVPQPSSGHPWDQLSYRPTTPAGAPALDPREPHRRGGTPLVECPEVPPRPCSQSDGRRDGRQPPRTQDRRGSGHRLTDESPDRDARTRCHAGWPL